MPRLRIVFQFLFLTFTLVFASSGDETQVIRSGQSVLSIYTYGEGARTRIAPELPDRPWERGKKGALTDVIANPPLSSSLRIRQNNLSSSAARAMTAAPTGATSSGKTARTNNLPLATGMSAELLPSGAMITIGWQPSPDGDVTGYNVYIGNANHQYALYQTVGNQTSASVSVGAGAVFVAVTAYTAAGLESPFSDVLTIGALSQPGAASPVGSGGSLN